MSIPLFLTPQDFDCLFLLVLAILLVLGVFTLQCPFCHIKLIDNNDRSDPCFYLWSFQFSFALFFCQTLLYSSPLRFHLVHFVMMCQQWTIFHNKNNACLCVCDNNVLARQCHPLRIPHAYHKKSIILILF